MDRNIKINESIFEEIDDGLKAYWLGFLAADGYLYSGKTARYIGLGLAKRDLNHIKKFKKFIDADYKIVKCDYHNSYSLRISNKKFCDDLRKHGIIERKSNKNYFLINFCKYEYRDFFIAGFFGGDGSIFLYIRKCKYKNKIYEGRYYRVQIDGNKNTLEDIKLFLLDKYDFNKIKIIKHGPIWRITWNSEHDIKEFSKLYLKSNENLVRKKEKIIEFLQGRRKK